MPSDCQASDPQRKRVLLIVEHFSIKTKEQRSKGFYCHFFFVFRNMQMNQKCEKYGMYFSHFLTLLWLFLWSGVTDLPQRSLSLSGEVWLTVLWRHPGSSSIVVSLQHPSHPI